MTPPRTESHLVMVNTLRAGLAIAGLWMAVAGARTADAQPRTPARPGPPRMAGKYTASFMEVSNNCSGIGMSLREATVELFQSNERSVQVTVPAVPIMRGVASQAGKFKADAKRGKTATDGVDGRFSVAGRVDEKGIQFLFIAEYYRGTKPICTQSWNASGPRQ